MLARLALLFVLVPILELAILVQLGRVMGLWPTLGLVLVTGVLGAVLTRAAGLRAYLSVQQELAGGRLPTKSLLDGLSILVGGAFLLTPGLLTDVVGFSLLFSPTRRWIQGRVGRWLEKQVRSGQMQVGFMGAERWDFRSDRSPGTRGLDPRNEIRPRAEDDEQG